MKRFRSIQWWLPLSYAGIALLTMGTLGAILLITLEDYYNEQERKYLEVNAYGIQHRFSYVQADAIPFDALQTEINNYAVLSRTKIEVLDPQQHTIVVSGYSPDFMAMELPFEETIQTIPKYADAGGISSVVVSYGTLAYDSGIYDLIFKSSPKWRPTPIMNVFAVGPYAPTVSEISEGREEEIPSFPRRFRLDNTPFGYQLTFGASTPEVVSEQKVTLPLYNANDNLLGYIILSEGPAFGTEIVNDVAQKLVIASAIAVFMAIIAGWLVSRNISRPVLKLSKATVQMSEGDLSVRIHSSRRDELGLLGRSFNEMAKRIEDSFIVLQRFVADAAHEINTPITALQTNLELAASETIPQNYQEYIRQALQQLARLKTLTKNLLDLTRLEANITEVASVNMIDLVRKAIESFASQAEQAGLTLEQNIPLSEDIWVRANEAQLGRVVDNLLDNAIKFTPEDGKVIAELGITDKEAFICVKDTGIGIPENDLNVLFNRFHRGRNATNYAGNGLGLAIVKTIVDKHNGRITVQSDTSGTCFGVYLPLEVQHDSTN